MCFGILDILFGKGSADGGVDGSTRDFVGDGSRESVFEDVPFQDFNNAWESNDDHNWEADGDTQWDSHGDGLPGATCS